jgi:hypothetical protein
VFIDGRQDPFPPSLLIEQKQVERSGHYEALFHAHAIRCAFVPNGTTVATRLQHDGWITRYADAQWTVLAAPDLSRRDKDTRNPAEAGSHIAADRANPN